MRSDIVKLNEEELLIIAKYFKIDGANNEEKTKQLLKQFSIKQMIITAGAEGAWMTNGVTVVKTDNLALSKTLLVDTVGAGDAFSAVCILAHSLNWDDATTLNRANHFASAICGIRGGAPADLSFYKPFIDNWNL